MKSIILILLAFVGFNQLNAQQVTVTTSSTPSSCDGTAGLNYPGGLISWTWLDNGGNPIQSGGDSLLFLCPGNYSLNYTDSSGSFTETFSVGVSPCYGLTATLQVNNDLMGNCSGAATIAVTGGTAPYQYTWNYQNQAFTTVTNSIPGLCAGYVSCYVTDSYGCTTLASGTVLNDPCSFTVTSTVTNESMNPGCDGEISLTVSNGVAPYSYSWSNGANTAAISNLCSGVYSLQIMDNQGCTDSLSFTISNLCSNFGTAISTVSNTDTMNCNGIIYATPYGGLEPYMYVWSNATVTQNQTDLCAGTYSAYIYDSNGCLDTISVTITDSITNPVDPCSNFAATISTVPNSDTINCNGIIYAAAYGGVEPYAYFWSNGSISQNQFNLCPATYTAYVMDANGCSDTVTVTISDSIYNNPGDPCSNIGTGVSLNNASDAQTCDGSIYLYGIANTTIVSYNWSNGSTSSTIDNLCPGFYEVNAIDSNGCPIYMSFFIQTDSIISPVLSAAVYVSDETAVDNCDGFAQVVVFGGVAPFQYIHSNGSTNNTAFNLCAGQYNVLVIDANNDSLYLDYLVSSMPVNIVYDSLFDSINVNTLYSEVIQNCMIDYNSIDSAYIYGTYSNNVDSISITWAIHTSNGWEYISADYYVGNSPSGVYTIELSLFCPQRSQEQYIKIYTELYINTDELGLIEQKNNSLIVSLYPNPFMDQLRLELPDNGIYELVLTDLSGRIIRKTSTDGSHQFILTGLSELSAGEYFLNVSGKTSSSTIKLVK